MGNLGIWVSFWAPRPWALAYPGGQRVKWEIWSKLGVPGGKFGPNWTILGLPRLRSHWVVGPGPVKLNFPGNG